MVSAVEITMHNIDQQLAARCRAGDSDAFARIYDLHARAVYRYAYHLLGHREDADDMKQETFVKAFQAMPGFRHESSLRTWLLRICANLCRDRIKSWDRRNVRYDSTDKEVERYAGSFAPDPHAVVERAQTTQIILCALQALPPSHREVIVLHEIEELGYADIGAVLGCSAASAKLRVFRARRLLKERVTSLMKSR